MKQRLYFLLARSALHVGTGHGSGMIDLPFIREKSTGLPVVPGSGVKGVLRETHSEAAGKEPIARSRVKCLFGSEYDAASEGAGDSVMQAGMLTIDDALLLCLPVRSMRGAFAWVSCPFALHRLRRSLRQLEMSVLAGNTDPREFVIPRFDRNEGIIAVPPLLQPAGVDAQIAILEELVLTATLRTEDEAARAGWAKWLTDTVATSDADWKGLLRDRFAIVSDEVFSFLSETASDVRARIRLDQDGVAANRGLWYEELFPADTLFWGHWSIAPVPAAARVLPIDQADSLITDKTMVIGGEKTVGRGWVEFVRLPPAPRVQS